jgi:ribose 5-phosphate isomerase B
MKIFIGADHAGFELKQNLVKFLFEIGYEVVDCGPEIYDENDDYPDFVKKVADNVSTNSETKGVVIGKSGQGEAMCANRFKRIRAAVYYGGSPEIVKLSREHNDANILSLGAGFLSEEEAKQVLTDWLNTSFSNEERHARRIAKLDN